MVGIRRSLRRSEVPESSGESADTGSHKGHPLGNDERGDLGSGGGDIAATSLDSGTSLPDAKTKAEEEKKEEKYAPVPKPPENTDASVPDWSFKGRGVEDWRGPPDDGVGDGEDTSGKDPGNAGNK
jgi:hypothetical protein